MEKLDLISEDQPAGNIGGVYREHPQSKLQGGVWKQAQQVHSRFDSQGPDCTEGEKEHLPGLHRRRVGWNSQLFIGQAQVVQHSGQSYSFRMLFPGLGVPVLSALQQLQSCNRNQPADQWAVSRAQRNDRLWLLLDFQPESQYLPQGLLEDHPFQHFTLRQPWYCGLRISTVRRQ